MQRRSSSLCQSYAPCLRASRYYEQLLKEKSDEKVREYLGRNPHPAEWLIKCVSQRENTLLGCIEAIVAIQREYFLGNSPVLVPMTLGNVAERKGVHKSTASRTIRGKFIQCSAGVLPIKSFFVQKLGEKTARMILRTRPGP